MTEYKTMHTPESHIQRDSDPLITDRRKKGSHINIPNREHFPSLRRKKVMQSQKHRVFPCKSSHLFQNLVGQQVALDGEHLARAGRDEAVDLAGVLVHLAGVEHALQAAGLGWELEQTLPLVLGEEGLVEGGAGSVLLGALRLPVVDLLLLAAEHTLVVLVVVDLGVVGLDAVQKEIAVLLQERVDAERHVFKVGGEGGGLVEGAGLEGGQGRRELS